MISMMNLKNKISFDENSENVFTRRIELAKKNYPDNKIVQEITDFLLADKNRSFCGFK